MVISNGCASCGLSTLPSWPTVFQAGSGLGQVACFWSQVFSQASMCCQSIANRARLSERAGYLAEIGGIINKIAMSRFLPQVIYLI